MVAQRLAPDATRPATLRPEEEEESSQYVMPIDQTQARYDPDSGEIHVFDFHEVFRPKPRLSSMEKRELAIKQAALRVAAGMEMRSLRALAHEIGCTHQALDQATLRLCEKLNMRKFHVSDST